MHIKNRIPLRLIRFHIMLVFRLSEFVNFSGEDSKSDFEHISQYLAQLGEVGSINELKVRLFYLSLTGTTFSWFFLWHLIPLAHRNH